MKTVITSQGQDIKSRFNRRFGRAMWFCVYDEETGSIEFHLNDNHNSNSGAGTGAAEKVIELKAGKVISGDFGPKAKDLLNSFKIQMLVIMDENLRVEDIIDKLKKAEPIQNKL